LKPVARGVRPGAALGIGGLVKMSASDWPGQLAAVVFCQGCSWRCRYCHNPHLVPFDRPPADRWDRVLAWLGRRRGLLDAVVFSGGEPTCQPGLAEAMRQVRELGLKVGLHTGGPSPLALAAVLPLVDWVGFDFKAPFASYAKVTGRDHGHLAQESFRLIREAGVPCEIRTTWHPALLSAADLDEMADTLASAGRREWVIQRFRAEGCADAELCASAPGQLPAIAAGHSELQLTVR
jgi:pyruvate formate lyase activating enzyme